MPLPVIVTFCGLPAASSLISSLAVFAPLLPGVKVTLIVHVVPFCKVVLAQPLSGANCGSVDVIASISNGTPLLLVSTICLAGLVVLTGTLLNFSVLGATCITPWMPLPFSVRTCGLFFALSVTVRVP